MTIYVSIGNSDEKLSQVEWSHFQDTLVQTVRQFGKIHGEWYSLPTSQYQNMCICFDIAPHNIVSKTELRIQLITIGRVYNQESIAWIEGTTEFLTTAPPVEPL